MDAYTQAQVRRFQGEAQAKWCYQRRLRRLQPWPARLPRWPGVHPRTGASGAASLAREGRLMTYRPAGFSMPWACIANKSI